jgi:alanine racemase
MLASADPVLAIDRRAVLANLRSVRSRLGGRALIAVLKDNAYGHGLLPLAEVLHDAGVRRFAVGSVEEAFAVQAPGRPIDVLNLRLFRREDSPRIVARGIVQSVFTVEQADLLAAAARERGRQARVHLNVDTGLRRFGVPVEAAPALLASLRARSELRVEGVFSTLTEDPALDREQMTAFSALLAEAGRRPGETWHLVSSHGLLRHSGALHDAARIGCLLCGFRPSEEPVPAIRPIARLAAPVLGIRSLRAGDRVGYRGRWLIPHDLRVATVGIGLRHGLRERFGERGEVLLDGRRHPVRQIASDHLVVELGGGTEPAPGDPVILLGESGASEVDLDTFARASGASRYTALSALGPAVRRVLEGEPTSPPRYGEPTPREAARSGPSP